MFKKIIILALAAVMALGIFATTATAAPLVAKPTASTVLVNGKNVAFDAYNINDNNYFKLRDLAYTLNGTAKQFAVGWDGANNAISLTSGQAYTPDGSEMKSKGAGNKTPTPTTSKITLDGKAVQFTAYNIEGNNYFKLRDIGQAFNFGVDWDGAKNTIVIDTSKGYTPEAGTATPPPSGEVDQRLIGTWYLGDSTLEIRRILKGNYGDIRRISFGYVGTSYTFNDNGTFLKVSIIGTQVSTLSSGQLVISEGKYSVSNGKITFMNVVTKATSNPNVPFEWEHTSNPPNETHSFEFGYDSDRERDKLFLDGDNDPGYTRTMDVV